MQDSIDKGVCENFAQKLETRGITNIEVKKNLGSVSPFFYFCAVYKKNCYEKNHNEGFVGIDAGGCGGVCRGLQTGRRTQ